VSQAAALVLYADGTVARAFLLTRLPTATPSGDGTTAGFLPAHSMGSLAGSVLPDDAVAHLIGRLALLPVRPGY
jgi:hypothetical protein